MNKFAMSGWFVVLLTLVLSAACSKDQPMDPLCSGLSRLPEEFQTGNPTLNVAAVLGTALELGENFYPSRETYRERYASTNGCYPSAAEYYYDLWPQSVRFGECTSGVANASNQIGRTNGIMVERSVGQLSYSNSSQAAFCPQSWEHFLQSPQSNVVRQLKYRGTGPGSLGQPVPVNASTGREIGGWDPQVTLTPSSGYNYGIKISTTPQGAVLKIHGANYRTPNWDHTISSGDLSVKINPSDSSKVVVHSGDQAITVQENIGYYTAKAKATDLSWDFSSSGCGCLPTSGKIETVFSGNVTGRETLTFSGCGTYELQRKDEKGNLAYMSHGKLNYCL